MKRTTSKKKIKCVLVLCGLILLATLFLLQSAPVNVSSGENIYVCNEAEILIPSPELAIQYVSLGVPDINSSFKTWMGHDAVTNKNSPQYKLIHTYGWCDENGFMRCSSEKDLGIEQDYYLVALGSYYGTKIGTKYKITLDTGRVFYAVLADCKSDSHTNSTNQYVQSNKNIVEFIVNVSALNKDVKRTGTANVHMPLNGSVTKIERMDFIYE